MSDLRIHFSNRQQADHSLSPGVHRVVRQANGALAIGDAEPGVLLAQFCVDRRGLWLQVPGGARVVHLNGRQVRRMALLRAGDAVYVDGVELLLQAPLRTAPAALDLCRRILAAGGRLARVAPRPLPPGRSRGTATGVPLSA